MPHEYSVHKDISCYEVVTTEKSVFLWDGTKKHSRNSHKKMIYYEQDNRDREDSETSHKNQKDSVIGKENCG